MSRRRNVDDIARDITGAFPKRITAPTPSGRQPSRVADIFRMTPPARVQPPVSRGVVPSDARAMQMRGIGLESAAAAKQLGSAGMSPEDIVAMITGALGAGPSGGGGGGGRAGGGGGAGVNRAAINDAIRAMTEANTASQGRVGQLFSGANTQLADMANRYAAAQQALAQGAGQTLGAFGVTGQQMNPMGMSAGDYLTSSQGLLTGLSAAQQAQMEAQRAAYQLILADMLKAGG
jgi:hypothetical protein